MMGFLGDAWDATGGRLVNGVGDAGRAAYGAGKSVVGGGYGLLKQGYDALAPAPVDRTVAIDAAKRAAGTQDFYHGMVQGLGPAGDPGMSADLNARGASSLNDLTAAAHGMVPSAAEIQGNRAAADAANGQFGSAAAFQGRSPAQALRMATIGAGDLQANAIANAAGLRAKEQADARAQLVQAIGQQQQVQTQKRAQDIERERGLIGADVGLTGQNIDAAKLVTGVDTGNVASANTFKGDIVGGIGDLAAEWAKKKIAG